MKSDNEVRNGRVHRKGIGAGGGKCGRGICPLPRTLFVAVRSKCNLNAILRNYEHIIRPTKRNGFVTRPKK